MYVSATGSSLQQQSTITGNVTDASNQPLPGVTVVVQGTSKGTVTNEDGEYTLTDVPDDATLVFSFVGMRKQEVEVEGRSTVSVMMEEETIGLEEVVAVGYGTMKKGHITGSSGSIQMDEGLDSKPMADFGSAMYGKVAGVQVRSASGQPGQSTRLQIRGINSISGGVMPLLVVDGVVLPGYNLNTINASDIESIEILKDAASSAIYGSRGSNGVILVTTKHGSEGPARLTFDYSYSIQEQMKFLDMMDGPQYAQAAIDNAQNGWIDSGGDPNAPNTIEARGLYKYTWPEELEDPSKYWDTDFQKLISRVAPMHRINMNLSGGDENTKYMVSAGLLDQEGIIITSGYKRLNLNMKIDSKINDWLTVGGMANISRSNESILNGSVMNAAREFPSIYPVYGRDGYLGGPMSVDGFENHYNILMRADNQGHPLWHTDGFDDLRQNYNLISSLFAEVEITPELKIRSSFNSAYRRYDRRWYAKIDRGVASKYQAQALSEMSRTMNYTSENLITYSNSWNDHQIDGVAGFEYNHREYYNLHGRRHDFDNDLIPYITAGSILQNTYDGANESTLISYFARLNYDYLGKYMASATFRQDGSSRFGPENKWGSFPSLSAGWRVSEELFMDDVNLLSNLTVRASLGFTGNEDIGNYRWISSMSKTQTAIGDNLISTYYPSSIQNEDLAWERSKQINIGFDIGLFDNNIYLTGDIYKTESDALLLDVPVPAISGFGSVFQNIGALETYGVELNLTTHNLKGAFVWDTDASFTLTRSSITQLGPDDAPMYLGRTYMTLVNEIGETPFSYYGYVYDGVYMNQAEIDAHGVEYDFDVKPGMGRYVDVTGDGVINADDRTDIGNPEPDFTWSLQNSFRYKNFDLSIQMHGSVGGQIYAAQKRRSIFNHEGRNYFAYLSDGAWRSEEEPGDGYHYKLSVDIPGFEKQASSYWLSDGTYSRLKNITLGYTLPDRYTEKLGIATTRVYFNGENLFTLQKSKSVADPENSTGSITDPATTGIQHNAYPTARIYTFGINVNF